MTSDAALESSSDQERVIAYLSDPASFACEGPVERIDTHAAIVFLAGNHAYKLKRAVRYPYLDFSTPLKRKAVCEAELALNRRTAPDLYLDVRFIGLGSDGHLAFGRGAPLDWVIVMKRFASECLLDTMAKSGSSFASPLLRQLADAIAHFHDRAEIIRDGGACRMMKVVEGNRTSMAALPSGMLDEGLCEQLFHATHAAVGKVAPVLDRRAKDGAVRHCHGDLHLANICVWHGRPTLFDCLEFDKELATSDVLYDLAFLLMDFWRRGLRAEASIVFNRYCDRRDETSGLVIVPLFFSMRAAVRAHVEASMASLDCADPESGEKLAEARDYLAEAIALLKKSRPRLVAVGGLSGSGKSTLARNLAPRIGVAPGARLLRTDMLRKRLAGVEPETQLPESAYTPGAHCTVYNALLQRARETLIGGWPVIVDAVFDFPETRSRMQAIGAELEVPFEGLWLEAPRDVLKDRVRSREDDASDAGPPVVDKQWKRDIGQLGSWRRIDASGTVQNTLDLVLHELGETE